MSRAIRPGVRRRLRMLPPDHPLPEQDPHPSADRLWDALAHIFGPRGGAPDPLRPGSRVAIMPTGEYCMYIPRGQYDPDEIALCTHAFPAPPPRQDAPPGGAPCALDMRNMTLPKPTDVAVGLFRLPNLRLPVPDWDREFDISTSKIPVPRSVLDGGGMELARRVMRIVCEDEGRQCLEVLGCMEHADWRPGAGSPAGMGALLESLGAANSGRPADNQLDTILFNCRSLAGLEGRHASHGDMAPGGIRAGGKWAIRTHDGVPEGVAYAMPSTGGPALLRGPTAIDCGRDGFLIRHYCVRGADPGGIQVALPGSGAAG